MSSYHHGQLRQALIDQSLDFLEGRPAKDLSLRALAQACQVSSAAPYAHFRDKADLLQAIRQEVIQRLQVYLQQSCQAYQETSHLFIQMGLHYILYFYQLPHYFNLLFEEDEDQDLGLQALDLLGEALSKSGEHQTDQDLNTYVFAMWSIVQGGLTNVLCKE